LVLVRHEDPSKIQKDYERWKKSLLKAQEEAVGDATVLQNLRQLAEAYFAEQAMTPQKRLTFQNALSGHETAFDQYITRQNKHLLREAQADCMWRRLGQRSPKLSPAALVDRKGQS